MARAEPRSAQFAVLGGAQRRIRRVDVEHFGFGDLRVRQAGFNDLRFLETGELGGMRIARLSLRTSGRGQCAGRQRLLERIDLGGQDRLERRTIGGRGRRGRTFGRCR